MNSLALEVACLNFVDTVRLFCVELSEPEVTLGCLQAIVTLDGFDNRYVETVALLTLTEFADLAQQAATNGQVSDCDPEKSALLAEQSLSLVIKHLVTFFCRRFTP